MNDSIRKQLLEKYFELHKAIHDMKENVWNSAVDTIISELKDLEQKTEPKDRETLQHIGDVILMMLGDLKHPDLPPKRFF